MILGLFLVLNFLNLILFFRKKYTFFLITFFTILFVEPIFQKLLDPTLFGDTYNVFGFDRFKTNLILISFLFIILIGREIKYSKNLKETVTPFVVITIVFHILNSLLSLNIEKSAIVMFTSVVGPIIFFYILLKIPSELFLDQSNLVRIINFLVIIFISIGVAMYINGSDNASLEYSRSGGGLWMSNISTQILAPFFPFLFTSITFKNSTIIKFTSSFLFSLLLIVAMSRTAAVVYVLMVLAIFWNKKGKLKLMAVVLIGLLFFLTILNQIFNIDIIEMYEARFFSSGDIARTVGSDSRFILYYESIDLIRDNPLMGIGIAAYSESNRGGFSNVHNLFLNVLIERGVLGLLILLSFIRYYVKINMSCLRNLNANSKEFFRLGLIGFIGFLVIGLTGNDLFVSSGFVNGWPTYILLFMLAVQINVLKANRLIN